MSSFARVLTGQRQSTENASQTPRHWNGARLSTEQEGTVGDLKVKVVGRGRNGRGRIQSLEIRLMSYDVSLCTSHVHWDPAFASDAFRGVFRCEWQQRNWRGEPLCGDPYLVYTNCQCASPVWALETVWDSNLSRLWAEMYSLSFGVDDVCPRVRSMSLALRPSHIPTQSDILVYCGYVVDMLRFDLKLHESHGEKMTSFPIARCRKSDRGGMASS